MPKPILGVAVDGAADIEINVEELIGSDICIVANKGAGKSGMVRVLCEVTRDLIQQIIIDPEGEFHTLRELGDYLIAGGQAGDCPATVANAAALALTLMENPGISAVIQLDHLKPWEQEEFVGVFLEAIMDAPRETWHAVLLVIDETHRFAPQDGNVASTPGMKDIIGRGRKRGITPVFATYRIAAIDKNVTAGSPTWFLGRVGQEIDRKAAAMALGFLPSSADAKEISFLAKRTFWTFGSATTPRPTLFKVSDAVTTMTKSGQAMAPVPPAPKSLQKLLQALSKAAAPETPAIPVSAASGAPSVDLEAIRRDAYQAGADAAYEPAYDQGWMDCAEGVNAAIQAIVKRDRKCEINVGVDDRDIEPDIPFPEPTPEQAVRAKAVRASKPPRPEGEMSEGAHNLVAAARMAHRPVSWTEAAMLAGRIPAGGYHNSVMKELRANGFAEPPPNDLSSDGPLYGAADLREKMAAGIGGKDKGAARAIFEHLWAVGPRTKLQIADDTGRLPSGGHWNATWKALRSSPRVHESDGLWDIAPILREVAGPPTAKP